MARTPKGNAMVGQSGGPTAVINQSLAGVIEEACRQDSIDQVLGAVHGVRGIEEEQFVDLKRLGKTELEKVANTPAAALGSTRDKPDEEYCHRIFEVFQKHNVRYFFYIGGNDSANTANIIHTLALRAGYEIEVYHIPKTIDNDLLVTDHCPGYGSAARFVAHALMGDDLDNRSLPGIKIDVIMGRDAGFLTAASVLARRHEDDGPHLIYVPEAPVSLEKFGDDVETTVSRCGRCVVAVSEGIRDVDGVLWAKKIQHHLEKDAHGNVQLSGTGALADFLIAKTKHRFPKGRMRADTFGYLQRCFPGLVSVTDAAEARLCGRMAVRYAVGPDLSGSIALRRLGNGPHYGVETFVTPLETVAARTKSLPKEYLNAAGNDILPSFREYAEPLVGPLPEAGHVPGV